MASPPANATTADDSPASQPILFRTSKKRKAAYRRPRSSEEDREDNEVAARNIDNNNTNHTTETKDKDGATPLAAATQGEVAPSLSNDLAISQLVNEASADAEASAFKAEEESSIAEALRLRNLRRSRLNGVGFKAQGAREGSNDNDSRNGERSLVPLQGDLEDGGMMTSRFAPQTGLVGELVNKHMMEYIESKLSSRKSPSGDPETSQAGNSGATAAGQPSATSSSGPTPHGPQRQLPIGAGIRQGRLMEVDLGDEARARNISMTERARRRLAGESGSSTPDDDPARGDDGDGDPSRPKKKVRLGRDGKPRRPRNRRGSDDLARDRLVEELMRENRLDVYDTSAISAAGASSTNNPDPSSSADPAAAEAEDAEAADDRLAEEFRREFLDAMAQRRRHHQNLHAAQSRANQANARKQGASGASGSKGSDEILRGPKLGGSRSNRAAMRDLLLEQQQQRKATR